MQKRIFILLLAVVLLVLAFPAAAQDDTLPRFEPSACTFTLPAGQTPECGYLVVPEDRSNPENSNSIRLAVAVFKTDNPNPQPDPVIYLDGGPGGSSLETIQFSFGSIYEPFLAERDVIAFDQRGVGQSEPALDCQELTDYSYEILDDELTTDEYVEGFKNASIACGERLQAEGIDLAAYNTVQSAADVNDLRAVLGYEQLNLFGISYGTRLALTVMRDFPEAVRSSIIDSVVPLQGSGFDDILNGLRAYDELFAACAGDTACDTKYPNLGDVFYGLIDQLNAEPVNVTVPNLSGGSPLTALVSGNTFAGLVFQALYSESLIGALPENIYNVQEGKYSFLSSMILLQLLQLDSISYGMFFSANCSDDYLFDTADSITAVLESLPERLRGFAREALIDPAQLEICTAWGTRQPDPLENQAVVSEIPTLVVAGQFDPITPPANAQLAAETLSNSFYVEVPGVGHGVIPSNACTQGIAAAFVNDPSTAPDSACLNDLPPVAFVPDASNSITTPVTMVEFNNALFGYSGVTPDGWDTVAPGTVMRGEGVSDQTLLMQLASPFTTPETFLPLITGQFGIEEMPEPSGTREANGLTWTLYELELLGFPTDMAVAAANGTTYFIMLTSTRNERLALYEMVFVPAIDGFTPAG